MEVVVEGLVVRLAGNKSQTKKNQNKGQKKQKDQ
jgi:hypothetical protein